ncbi:MAG: hypothetical protein A4E28_01793 [Methanocella sp. PtaU1.Bin125]|nr:MAG: hypothetical protein A4E28_01793 [Methanocella sp. PtaU1.Bin125]
MSSGTDIVKLLVVVMMFGMMLYAGYYATGQIELPAILTNLLPEGTVVGWNDRTIVFPDVDHSAEMWLGSQVLPGEMDATKWINDHTEKSDKFVADIGGAEAIMGMTTRVSLVGGDWANAPDPVKNMETAGRIYSTDDAAEAHAMAVANGCDYIFLPDRRLNTGTFDNYASTYKFSNTTYFQLVYTNDDVNIYRVLP